MAYRRVGGGRKKTHTAKRKTTHRRRRHIGAAGNIGSMATEAVSIVAGAVAAREFNTLAVKFFPSLSPMVSGILQVGLGFALPKFVKGSFVAGMGKGMIANGGMVAIVSTGLINGSDTMTYRINGTNQLSVVGRGTDRINVINGPNSRVSNPAPVMIPGRRTFSNTGEGY